LQKAEQRVEDGAHRGVATQILVHYSQFPTLGKSASGQHAHERGVTGRDAQVQRADADAVQDGPSICATSESLRTQSRGRKPERTLLRAATRIAIGANQRVLRDVSGSLGHAVALHVARRRKQPECDRTDAARHQRDLFGRNMRTATSASRRDKFATAFSITTSSLTSG